MDEQDEGDEADIEAVDPDATVGFEGVGGRVDALFYEAAAEAEVGEYDSAPG